MTLAARKLRERQERLQYERGILLEDYGRPGFQLLIKKMQDLSDEMLNRYDSAQTMEEVMRIQAYRDVIETIIPRALELAMNCTETERKWSFSFWASKAFKWARKNDRGWLVKAATLFRAAIQPGK